MGLKKSGKFTSVFKKNYFRISNFPSKILDITMKFYLYNMKFYDIPRTNDQWALYLHNP